MIDYSDDENLPIEDLIEKYSLYPHIEMEEDENGVLINETWTSPIHEIILERFYYFDIYFTDMLPDEVKKDCLDRVMRIYVENEMYEEAAILRDEIQLL